MTDFKIEKNIPLPQSTGAGRPKGGLKDVLRNMDVGDSVFCANSLTARTYRMSSEKETGFKFATRKENGGSRIWRTA